MNAETWYEPCPYCGTEGCENCGDEGYLEHAHQADLVEALVAHDDQLKADMTRDAQMAAYHKHVLMEEGFTEGAAESMVIARYEWMHN